MTPSATLWLRARRTPPPQRRTVVLVAGPGLVTGGAEVPVLAARHAGATTLTGRSATADRVLAALDGAWLAHIAAHGTFRADSPLFSALRLDDGPLTVYDLERLRRAPHRIILSSCESGRAVPVGADELLGLATSLLPRGTVGILAAVVPVNDEATVEVMTSVHDGVAAGHELPDALLAARRRAAGGDPLDPATACSFLALGV